MLSIDFNILTVKLIVGSIFREHFEVPSDLNFRQIHSVQQGLWALIDAIFTLDIFSDS